MEGKVTLSLRDTNILKGIALMMLLTHHLFYVRNGLYDDIRIVGDHYLVNEIGIWSKLCVAIFVFLSGYGLMVRTTQEGGIANVKRFYLTRLSKLLVNYWFVWLLFVPVGVFVFGRTFSDAYGSYVIPKFILDIMGLISCIGIYGYNPTWWFLSCIIVLYICFPYCYKLINKNPVLLFVIIVAIYFMPLPRTIMIRIYFPSFVMGMALYKYMRALFSTPPHLWIVTSVILSVERFVSKDVFLFDSVLCLAIAITYLRVGIPKMVGNTLDFIGRHSSNIFMFHTFIYYYWFSSFIYGSRNPILIFMLLLCISLFISVILEFVKNSMKLKALIQHINSLYAVRQ